MLRSTCIQLICIAALLCAGALAQQPDSQLPDAPQPQAQAPPPQSPPSADDQQNQTAPGEKKKPDSRMKRTLKRGTPNCIKIMGAEKCKETTAGEQADDTVPPDQQPSVPSSQPLPRSANPDESSSKETDIPLGLPGSTGRAPSDVQELHPWNPHQADKDVEVGDFYFKRDNYRAAESRYAEALEYMPNHAEATFKLAVAEEKLGKTAEARAHYENYLKILPEGDFAKQAREALARLRTQAKETTSPPAQKRP